MKKRSRWILIMSALLCLCMLFASCQSGKVDETSPSETIPEEPIPENQEIDYATIIGEWTKYLKYDPAEDGGYISADKVFSYDSRSNKNMTDLGNGFFCIWEEGFEGRSYRVYNVQTGVTVLNVEAELCSFRTAGCILEVRNTENDVYTYDYYDSNGEKINTESLDEQQTIINNGNGTYSVLGKAYRIEEGRIVETFKAGQEVAIVADVEYKGNKYIFGAKEVTVYGADNKKLAALEMREAEWDDNYWILSNGNVLAAYNYILPDDAKEYTVELDDTKCNMEYLILDITTGEVTEIPATFVITSMITPAEGQYNLAVKGEYQFATVYPIADKKLVSTPNFVIFDDALAVSAELPKIVKNQSGIYGAADDNTLIVSANVNYSEWLYSADLKSGEVELYANLAEDSYRAIDGGFIYDSKVYDDKMNEVMDLSKYQYQIKDGMIFAKRDPDNWHLVVVGNGNAGLKDINEDFNGYSVYNVEDGKIFVVDGKFYTDNGTLLFDSRDGIDDYYSVVDVRSDSIVVKTSVSGVTTYYIVG